MILFSNCKINLGLNVLRKRADGYHDLETVMFPVRGLCDAVEIIHSTKPGVSFTWSGLPVEGDPKNNLCVRAYNALNKHHPLGGVKIHLHKVIPMGAGIGGGSANAATVIQGLIELFGLHVPQAEQEAIAAQVGSDTAFFIANRPALATSRGEVLQPIHLPQLENLRLLLVKPQAHISTAQAYAGVTPHLPAVALTELLQEPIQHWKQTIHNAFEPSVFALHPHLQAIKEGLYAAGAVYASMSGSGSSIYGFFEQESALPSFNSEIFVYQEVVREQGHF